MNFINNQKPKRMRRSPDPVKAKPFHCTSVRVTLISIPHDIFKCFIAWPEPCRLHHRSLGPQREERFMQRHHRRKAPRTPPSRSQVFCTPSKWLTAKLYISPWNGSPLSVVSSRPTTGDLTLLSHSSCPTSLTGALTF